MDYIFIILYFLLLIYSFLTIRRYERAYSRLLKDYLEQMGLLEREPR